MQESNEAHLVEENKKLRIEVEHLQQLIRLLKRDKFGSTSEKLVGLAAEQLIFNELEMEAKAIVPEQTEMIEGFIDGNAVNPCIEFGLSIKVFDRQKHIHKNLLCEVFGF